MGMDAHDVPWGTGVCDVKGMLIEIHRQKLKAVFSIEYEYHWDNSLPEIAKCVAYFDRWPLRWRNGSEHAATVDVGYALA